MTDRDLPRLTQPRDVVQAELEERIILGRELRAAEIRTEGDLEAAEAQSRTWRDVNIELLRHRFTSDEVADEYKGWPRAVAGRPTPQARLRRLHEDLDDGIRKLNSIREKLRLYHEAAPPAPPVTTNPHPPGESIFIVHGHDDARKEALARFLETITDREVVILHEVPDRGRTVIEKLVDEAAKATFAVILLTADDFGRDAASPVGADQPRARQNVILEAGYFMGHLGRARVDLLYEDGVELPSDVRGVLYTALDAGGAWKTKLARELQAADIGVDTTNLLR